MLIMKSSPLRLVYEGGKSKICMKKIYFTRLVNGLSPGVSVVCLA